MFNPINDRDMNKKEARRIALERIYEVAIIMGRSHLENDKHYYSASDYKKIETAFNEECVKIKSKL